PDDEVALFMHDVPRPLAEEALRRSRHQSPTPGRDPWPLPAWPDVPTRFLLRRADRSPPPEFTRRVARNRRGLLPAEAADSPGVPLSRPGELADRLEAFR